MTFGTLRAEIEAGRRSSAALWHTRPSPSPPFRGTPHMTSVAATAEQQCHIFDFGHLRTVFFEFRTRRPVVINDGATRPERPTIAPPSAAVGRTLKHDRSVDSQHSRRFALRFKRFTRRTRRRFNSLIDTRSLVPRAWYKQEVHAAFQTNGGCERGLCQTVQPSTGHDRALCLARTSASMRPPLEHTHACFYAAATGAYMPASMLPRGAWPIYGDGPWRASMEGTA
jgi:hypothetical protein